MTDDSRQTSEEAELTCNCSELPHHPLCIENARPSPSPDQGLAKACEHDWMLFANELVTVRRCRRCKVMEDAS